MFDHALCLAWSWEHDADFVRLTKEACTRRGLSLLQVTPENLDSVLAGLALGEITFSALLDRASDTDDRFQPLVDWANQHGICCINPQKQSRWAWDKATMHLEFISRGLHTPYTIILPPFNEHPSIPAPELSLLGGRFAIKPAGGGGGLGVTLEAVSQAQVEAARREHSREKVLLQSHVTPRSLDSRPAWFRVLVCDGAVYPCWWDPRSHTYMRVTSEEKARFGLQPLREIAARITQICHLQLFSTEIALTDRNEFVVVDYVNDPIDLRLQSRAVDGVPDAIVENIAGRLVRLAESQQ